MALIGKIRNNSWILIVMIAVGMGGFILQDVVTNQGQRQSGNFEMANVNGKSIDYRDFQKTEGVLYSGASNQDAYAQKASLWRYFTEKAIVESESEGLGLGVSTEELLDLQFGQKLSPIITARFKNQAGGVDRERLNSFRNAIETDELDDRFKEYWAVQEKEIIKDRQQTKLQNLFTKAVYTPKWMAEELSKEANSSAEFEYVKIPFDKISDDQIELTDEAIKAYLKENAKKYQNTEETRIMDFIEFTVLPTRADSLKNKAELGELVGDFKNTDNDSLFVVNNSGNYSFVYYKSEDLPELVKNEVQNLEISDVYGPYFDTDKFTIAKLVDKKIVADSVKARHILRSINPQDPNTLTSAQSTIDSLKNLLDSGLVSFDSLAIKFSNDPGSSTKGGDLGYFAQGTMVPPFNYACFFGDENEYQVVNTRFGVHLIEIQDKKYIDQTPKYKVAYISNAIVPSQETQDSLYEMATELVTSSSNLTELAENISTYPGLEVKKSNPYKQNDYFFMNFGSASASRDIIRWAYEPGAEVGDISPVIHTYTDKINYFNSNYIVVGLNQINPAGLKSVDEARTTVEIMVANKLKAKKIVEQISNTDLLALASQFALKVDTLASVNFNSSFMPNLGNEPSVLRAVFNGSLNETSKPIIGNSGVFVVKPTLVNRSEQAAPNFLQLKTSSETQVVNEANYRFMEALKNNADMEDNRYIFY